MNREYLILALILGGLVITGGLIWWLKADLRSDDEAKKDFFRE